MIVAQVAKAEVLGDERHDEYADYRSDHGAAVEVGQAIDNRQ